MERLKVRIYWKTADEENEATKEDQYVSKVTLDFGDGIEHEIEVSDILAERVATFSYSQGYNEVTLTGDWDFEDIALLDYND